MEDLAHLLDPALRLPIDGREWVIQPPSAAVGLRLEALFALTLATRDGSRLEDRHAALLRVTEDVDLARDALGPVYEEMVAAGLSLPFIRHAGQTAFLHWTSGPRAGAAYWASVGRDYVGKVPARSGSTRTGAASTTRTRASTSGTTRRRKRSSPRPGKG